MTNHQRQAQPSQLRFLPTNDLLFKRIMTDRRHRDVLAGLITDFFAFPVRAGDIAMLSTESVSARVFLALPEEEQKRLTATRRDVTVEIRPANVTIEMQVHKDRFFVGRSLAYASQLFLENLGRGSSGISEYEGLKPVWSLGILAHRMFDDDSPFRIASLREEESGQFLHLLADSTLTGRPWRLAFFEIPKQLTQPTDPDDTCAANRSAWAQFFATGMAPAGAPSYIQTAAEIVNLVNTTPEETMMLTKQQQFLADLESISNQKWYEEGREEGKVEERQALAAEMLRQGLDSEMIARITGLNQTEIQEFGARTARLP